MIDLFNNSYYGKTVLITGHTGFKGSWLSHWLVKLGANVIGYSLANSSHPNHFKLLNLDIDSATGDILDEERLNAFFKRTKPEIVFHLAAQSLVRESYKNPILTYKTNVVGTLNVMEACRKNESVKALVNVTTDKVYEHLGFDLPFAETDRLGGYDPYSSSKACSEILSSSYRHSYLNLSEYGKSHQLLLATARAGNVIGGGDWAVDRLLPDVIRASVNKSRLTIRNPNAIRPWQHVVEPLYGYLLLGQKLLGGNTAFADAWNFGPSYENCLSVGDILAIIHEQWSDIQWDVDSEAGQPHEASILKLDSAKSAKMLQWHPVLNIEETIEMTLNWYRSFYNNKTINTASDLEVWAQNMKK